MSEVIKYNKIDLTNINYTKPTNQQNAYYGGIDYNKNLFLIQTSHLTIQSIKDKIITVSVDTDDFSFYDTIVQLDDHNLASTYKNSNEWFNKELPMDVLENMYRRMSKPFKKGEIPFHVVVYNCSHNEQHSGKEDIKLNKICTDKMIYDFSIKTLEA